MRAVLVVPSATAAAAGESVDDVDGRVGLHDLASSAAAGSCMAWNEVS